MTKEIFSIYKDVPFQMYDELDKNFIKRVLEKEKSFKTNMFTIFFRNKWR